MKVPPMAPSAEERATAIKSPYHIFSVAFADAVRLGEEAHSDGYAAGFAAALRMLREPPALALVEAVGECFAHAMEPLRPGALGEMSRAALIAVASALADIAEKEGGDQ